MGSSISSNTILSNCIRREFVSEPDFVRGSSGKGSSSSRLISMKVADAAADFFH